MESPRVCLYYQKGHCVYGDSCKFVHPTKRCRVFQSTGHCQYGIGCRYWHDHNSVVVTSSIVPKTCQFFANGQCKYADKCLLSHDLDTSADKAMTLSEYKASKKTEKVVYQSTVAQKSRSRSVQKCPTAFQDPSHANTEVNSVHRKNGFRSDEVTKADINEMRECEVEKLFRKFSCDQIRKLQSCGDEQIFCLKFSSSKPNWPYVIKDVLLNIKMVPAYPMEPLEVVVSDQATLPMVLKQHLNFAIAAWIATHHQFLKESGYVEVYMHPFFQWLNQRLEHLFTEGLRKLKSQVDNEFVQNSEVNICSGILTGVALGNEEVESSLSDECRAVPETQTSITRADDACSHTSSCDYLDDTKGEWIAPVIPGETSGSSTCGDSSDSCSRSCSVASSRTSERVPTPNDSVGTQSLSLSDLQLSGKTGVCILRRLKAYLHCTRCRFGFFWTFLFPGSSLNKGSSSSGEESNLLTRSVGSHSARCVRCSNSFKLIFERKLVHSSDTCVGTFFLSGCIADDIPPRQSDMDLQCTECYRYITLANVDFEKQLMRRCFRCNVIVSMKFDRFDLKLLNEPTTVTADSSATKINHECKRLSRRNRSALKGPKNPIIQDGKPLPFNGTCNHYRKSYRWLRFPCCGLLLPCDVCHYERCNDDHEMEFATRMICGFCSKEQPFSSTTECVRCGKSLVPSRTAFWEGGKGCRNRQTMSKKDDKKYSNLSKTVPKGKK